MRYKKYFVGLIEVYRLLVCSGIGLRIIDGGPSLLGYLWTED